MNYRELGRSGIKVSELGFGCGSVGGLMIRGERPDRVRAIERAIEAGITYFDTARSYGSGVSETNLGEALKELNADVVVGTKINIRESDLPQIADAVAGQIDEGLSRLQRDAVDVILMHNSSVGEGGSPGTALTLAQVEEVAGALESAVLSGKTRIWGINGTGDTQALHAALDGVRPGAMQTVYNLLNPSNAQSVPDNFDGQDYNRLAAKAREAGTGVVGIRILAAGALSGNADRHPIAAPSVGSIGSPSYDIDSERALAFHFLIDEGIVTDGIEAAIRYAISTDVLSTALVGLASLDQLEHAIHSVERGPLPEDALSKIADIQANTFVK